MSRFRLSISTILVSSVAAAALLGASACAQQPQPPLIQPGAPGQASRALEGREAARVADNRYSADDVAFMQGMIHHHGQAVEMAALVQGRTNTQSIVDLSGRINASQADEIKFMQGWLKERGEDAPAPTPTTADAHAQHTAAGHGASHATMPGMATAAQMAELKAANGAEFDRQFLKLMIAHHEGAVTMVNNLVALSGSAYDPALFRFTNDVSNEQKAEIGRMTALMRSLIPDPRATLKAGFLDAGQAISNMTLIASLPKPTGFFDPSNPGGLPMRLPSEKKDGDARAGTADEFSRRAPFLSFANTDMAFSGDLLAVGNYQGVQFYRLGGKEPKLISAIVCPGGQGDVSIVGNLLLMSVEATSGRVDCGREGVGPGASPERFRGLRIFDISNIMNPRQVGQVQTCRGSHTHSVVSADADRLVVYNSGTAGVRDDKELAGCIIGQPGDNRTALFRVDVIEIPVADPSKARIIDSPTVFADAQNGKLGGLWLGGDHGEGTQTTNRTDHCHDITLFPSKKIAGGACSGNGIIFDITDPRAPKRIDAVVDAGFAYWHSATFNNDGTKVVFTDEWGGGGRPRCRVQDPQTWGANAIYDIVDGKLVFRSYYKLPAAQTDLENCVAHNGSLIPVPGRDLFVQAWYQGGLSISDFTDSANPREIAYFDRGPVDAKSEILGGYWSIYWYEGRIYGTEIARGLDVFELKPSEYLSANEIAAARMGQQGRTVNPQQQYPVTWPAHPVVARAYMDQLARNNALPADAVARLNAALDKATPLVDGNRKNATVAKDLRSAAETLAVTGQNAQRLTALRDTLTRIADRVA
ncbi:MAG: DUF305 domain-containing protein [Alphaproteobacteria bacterium]|nr:MAG: DUF305 domain-containing protein [Alphaproteobacteria bacterium]